jgi:hypothetical protein
MFFVNVSFRRRFRQQHDAMEADNGCPAPLRLKLAMANAVCE